MTLPRPPKPPTFEGEPARFYTLNELAAMWRIHPVTVRKWLGQMRRSGKGPQRDQAKFQFVRGARRNLTLRADYAFLVEKTYMKF